MKFRQKRKKQNDWGKIVDFCERTTLHGVRHLVDFNRHWTEILLWTIVVILLCVGSTLMIYNSWNRFNTNPTVISIQKDYRTWKTAFPAATVCFANKLDVKLAERLIKKNWPGATEEQLRYSMSFLYTVANAEYKSLNHFLLFRDDKRLDKLDLLKLATQVSINMTYDARVFDMKFKDLGFLRTLTEMGICYTFGGVLSQSYTQQTTNTQAANKNVKPPYCSFQNPLCYASIEDLPVNLSYYIHSAYEMPVSGSTGYKVQQNMERETTFRFLETVASKALRHLLPEQRRCRVRRRATGQVEGSAGPGPLQSQHMYHGVSETCRLRLLSMFATFLVEEWSVNTETSYQYYQVCGVEGLACLARYFKTLMTIKSQGPPFNCDCLPNCEDIKFFLDKNTKREWLVTNNSSSFTQFTIYLHLL
ncbi:sodium channel protein Nach-like [Nilaparvata lugens]|uniref:sodium channel protein Nach-like n=1 Tax=Nilaparvata lugens TaxID=108931 RepID=UPI00193CDB4C|nr:sodium channel protein Nach-like [Nilaparvata lugens]